jgi:hypothetical protein
MVQSYRDKEKGYSRIKTIESFGYLDELKKQYEDPIAHFTKLTQARTIEAKQALADYTITTQIPG